MKSDYMNNQEIIETKRLIMRRLMPEDYKVMTAWDMDERVYKYLLGNACKTPEEPLAWLPKKDPTSKVNILMLVSEKEDGHAVGIYALNHDVERDVWSLSYVNRYDDWGKGYTVEGMNALMQHAAKAYGARTFEGECAKENIGSRRVMEKLGMVYDHSSSYSKNDGSATFESEVYSLTIMMEYKKIAIIGAGAVGSYILWGLSQKENIELSVVASGERKEKLETEGIYINDQLYKPVVKTPKEAHGADLVILAVKYNALPSAVIDIKEIIDEHTVVMSLMNGVDSEEVLASEIGEEHILPALIKVASERKQNRIYFDPESTMGIIYGEKDGRSSERTRGIEKVFQDTGLHYRETDVILSEIWSKFRLNVGNNLPQAMLGVGVGAYGDSAHVAAIRDGLVKELEAIAKAKGIDISLADPTSIRGSKVFKRARYSTLQDLDAKRHTEIDMFSGALIRMGKELGIATPYNEFTFHMIKALEEKNDGIFDYSDGE